jgi:hypothetical protein
VAVEHADATLGNCADPKLRVAGRANLSHHEHIQRRFELLRDFISDRYPASRQPQHDGMFSRRRAQALAERAPSLAPIDESCGR